MITKITQIDTLISEINQDLSDINETVKMNQNAWKRLQNGSDEYLDLAALGYTIHNLYGIMENGLFRIAKAFENNLDPKSWHKDLLKRMKLEISEVRPAVISRELYLLLDDLRGFRHVFWNQYHRDLDRDRISLLESKLPAAVDLYRAGMEKFIAFLIEIKKGLA